MTIEQAFNPIVFMADVDVLAGVIASTIIKPTHHQKAQALWQAAGLSWNGIYQMDADHMKSIVGAVATRRLTLALDTGRRKCAEYIQKLSITDPSDVASLLLLEMSHLQTEHLRVVILNTKNHILKITTISVGCINSTNVRIAEVFCDPIKLNAAAIILVHNHPSGDPTPSPEDVLITKQITQAGQLLEIDVLDHLVIGQARWVSMRERRLGWH